jgi:hypothetical protein
MCDAGRLGAPLVEMSPPPRTARLGYNKRQVLVTLRRGNDLRKYTVLFMEQRIGRAYLSQVPGENGSASFEAVDDPAALAYLLDHLTRQMTTCARAELSSMAIVQDTLSSGGTRVVDDSLENPYCQEMSVKYDLKTKQVEVDFESTKTALIADAYVLRQ